MIQQEFVVVDSSTCRLPSVSRLSHSTTSAEQNEDKLDANDDVSQQFQTNGKVVNMRIDIKMKVHKQSGTIAPPSTPSPIQGRENGSNISPNSHETSSTEICISNISGEDETQYRNFDLIDAYAAFERSTNIAMLRNRSAPPTISQYRNRLSMTSQWIKKRAVLESTNLRKRSKVGRPTTSVRPFSEREMNDEEAKLQLSKICIEPPSSRTPMPDLGYFRGKPPISPTVRNSRNSSIQYKTRNISGNESTVDEKVASSRYFLRNKKEYYVSDLGKSVKTRTGRIHDKKRYKTVFQESGRNPVPVKETGSTDSVVEVNKDRMIDSTSIKNTRPHTVSQKVIDELSNQVENHEKKHILEIKGKIPPAIITPERTEESENTISKDKISPQNLGTDHIVFQRSKTMPQKPTTVSNRPSNKDVPVNYILNRLQYYHSKKIAATPGMVQKENLLPYLRLHQSLNGYKSKSSEILQNPFGRTLI